MTELEAVKTTLSIMILLADRKLHFKVPRKTNIKYLNRLPRNLNGAMANGLVSVCNLFETTYILAVDTHPQRVLDMNFGRKNVCCRPE